MPGRPTGVVGGKVIACATAPLDRRDQALEQVQSVARVAKFKLTAFEPKEWDLQRSVADMLDWLLLPPAFYTAFPAGWGKLPPRVAGMLKVCGLKAGFPDIIVFDRNRAVVSYVHPKIVGIELKRPSKKTATSDDQDAMHAKLLNIGIPVYICWTIDMVIDVIDKEQINRRPHFLDQERNRGTA